MMQDRAIVIYGRRIGNRTQAFEWYQCEWPSVTYNADFKVTIIQRQITRKWYNIVYLYSIAYVYTYNGRPIKSYMIYGISPFSVTLNNPYPRFQGTPFFDPEYLRHGTRYEHGFNGILRGTYARPLLNSVISNDLEWLSEISTFSVKCFNLLKLSSVKKTSSESGLLHTFYLFTSI